MSGMSGAGARVPLRIAAMVALPCLVVGVVAGAALSKSHAATHPMSRAAAADPADDSPSSRTVVVAGATTAHLADDDRAALRALIRDELAAAAAKNAAPPAEGTRAASSAEPATERTLSDDDLKVYDHARATVDNGIARGNWTAEDRAQLHEAFKRLPQERFLELVQTLFVAINQGQVHVEEHGPAF
jgi:hypothetical protein